MVFRINACIKCGTATIDTCCVRCVQKCVHSWVEVHTDANLVMAVVCTRCYHTTVVKLKGVTELMKVLEVQHDAG